MAEFGKVWHRIWTDEDFTALHMSAQHLYLMLISNPSRSNAGVVALTPGRWATLAPDSTRSSVQASLNELSTKRFVVIDEDTEEVYIRSYIRNDGGWKTPSVMCSLLRSAQVVQSPGIRALIGAELLGLDDKEGSHEIAKTLVGNRSDSVSPYGAPYGAPCPTGSLDAASRGLVVVEVKVPVGVEPSFNKEGTNFSVQLNGSKVPVATEVRGLVHAVVPKAVLRAQKTRDGLFGHTQHLADEGATESELRATLAEWCNRTDVFPGHLPHIYAELARKAAGAMTTAKAQESANPSTTDQRVSQSLRLADKYAAEEARKELA